MSSPNAKAVYSLWDRLLIRFHRGASHHRRVQILTQNLAPRIPAGARLLDIGCGDLSLAAGIAAARGLSRCVGADIWPARSTPPERCEYVTIAAGQPLPWDAATFDVVLLIDTLHHCDDPAAVLREALRVGRKAIVKDHFEYGFWSRKLLQAMDYVGNHGYGVAIPGRYFSPDEFAALVRSVAPQAQCTVEVGMELYNHLPVARWLLSPKLHFVAEIHHV